MADSSYYQVRAMSHRADARSSDTRDTDAPRPTVALLPELLTFFSALFSPGQSLFAALSRPYYCCWDRWIFLACRISDSSLRPRTVESHPRPVGGWIPFPYHSSATIDSPELFASVPTIKRRHMKCQFPAAELSYTWRDDK
jgi:hypothetical protein